MTDIGLILEAFHFLRPWWLILLPVILVSWWLVRKKPASEDATGKQVAPHLREALTVQASEQHWLKPIDGIALFLAMVTLGAAGPTWSRVPDPFFAKQAPLVIIVEVTPSMTGTDIAPSRLERGKQKIRDLLDLRAGSRTAVVGYSGSAHLVVPMTEDPGVVVPYLEGLGPDVMPSEGLATDLAIGLALDLLDKEATPGAVLLVGDGVAPSAVSRFNESEQTILVLSMLPAGRQDRGFDALSAPVLDVSPDDSDVEDIDRRLNAAHLRAMLDNADQPWDDRGHWLGWVAAFIGLFYFRRGWVVRWASVFVIAASFSPASDARADGVADWFFTPDQQGRLAFERKEFGAAAEAFSDPLWKGYAQYRSGKYEEAITTLGSLDTAQAAFIQGMAHIKSRGYRDGVRAFELALDRDPDFPGAEENLATARQIVEYVEEAREQSDTGEEGGIGADDVVFDNEEARGTDTQIEVTKEDGPGLMTTQQWMNTVDTRTSDFLRQRFALEAARRNPEGAEQ